MYRLSKSKLLVSDNCPNNDQFLYIEIYDFTNLQLNMLNM